MADFGRWMAQVQARVEAALQRALPAADRAPARLHEAMRYAVLGGGKRVRPLLVFAAGQVTGAPEARVDAAAVAVECIHAYSLVHDDMPCMDDDVLRRGRPTVHVQYDEATALLVGDALQSLAFELLARPGVAANAPIQVEMISALAVASGSHGMAGGQAIDLAAVGATLTLPELEMMHIHKTGALIRASAKLGALAGESNPAAIEAIDRYAKYIGLAFQVVDDVLDAAADTETLGKTAGKDAAQGKPTYVSLLGLAQAKSLAEKLREDAHTAIAGLGPQAVRLRELADFVVRRRF